MKGTIRWYSATPSTGEFQYDISQRDFDTDKESVKDTVIRLLSDDWNYFGEAGDTIIVVPEDSEDY